MKDQEFEIKIQLMEKALANAFEQLTKASNDFAAAMVELGENAEFQRAVRMLNGIGKPATDDNETLETFGRKS